MLIVLPNNGFYQVQCQLKICLLCNLTVNSVFSWVSSLWPHHSYFLCFRPWRNV